MAAIEALACVRALPSNEQAIQWRNFGKSCRKRIFLIDSKKNTTGKIKGNQWSEI